MQLLFFINKNLDYGSIEIPVPKFRPLSVKHEAMEGFGLQMLSLVGVMRNLHILNAIGPVDSVQIQMTNFFNFSNSQQIVGSNKQLSH